MRAKLYEINVNNMDILFVNLANAIRAGAQFEVVSGLFGDGDKFK